MTRPEIEPMGEPFTLSAEDRARLDRLVEEIQAHYYEAALIGKRLLGNGGSDAVNRAANFEGVTDSNIILYRNGDSCGAHDSNLKMSYPIDCSVYDSF